MAAIAIPQYQTYTNKAKFTEVIGATAPYKLGVEVCYSTLGTLTGCNAGKNGIPVATTASSGYVASVAMGTDNGKITATASASVAVQATYVLTPSTGTSGGSAILTWKVDTSSTCIAAAYC